MKLNDLERHKVLMYLRKIVDTMRAIVTIAIYVGLTINLYLVYSLVTKSNKTLSLTETIILLIVTTVAFIYVPCVMYFKNNTYLLYKAVKNQQENVLVAKLDSLKYDKNNDNTSNLHAVITVGNKTFLTMCDDSLLDVNINKYVAFVYYGQLPETTNWLNESCIATRICKTGDDNKYEYISKTD